METNNHNHITQTNGKTSWTIFDTNQEAWNAMLEDCRRAEHTIELEQFIFTPDEFGQKMIDICAEKAKQGVDVKFLWDSAGSFSLWTLTSIDKVRESGIKLMFWKTLVPSYFSVPNFRSWFLRNHRRTLVIDHKVAYTGSMCIKDKMMGWRDTNVRLEGPVVKEMSNAFERMWHRANSQRLPKRVKSRDHQFRYVTNFPAPSRRHIYAELLEAIRSARKYIYITTPYFVPSRRLARVIKLAAHRGVDVKIIIPEKSDHYAIDIGARSYFQDLMESGVKIYLYYGNMIHSKSMVIDGEWASVGSMNLDRVSMFYNFEANIITRNSRFAEELASHFVHDMQNTKEVDYELWKNRFFVEKLPEIAIKVVRKFL